MVFRVKSVAKRLEVAEFPPVTSYSAIDTLHSFISTPIARIASTSDSAEAFRHVTGPLPSAGRINKSLSVCDWQIMRPG
jgi:hypothetical protein